MLPSGAVADKQPSGSGHQSLTGSDSKALPDLQALRHKNPYMATGLLLSLMLGHKPFAERSFGSMSRLIAGHVNRGHYCIIFRDGQAKGFVGWALTTPDAALAWRDGDGSAVGDGRHGHGAVVNFWVSDGPDMNSYILRTLRTELSQTRLVTARRIYSDGRIRPVTVVNRRAPGNLT